jgi:hypothetical protein
VDIEHAALRSRIHRGLRFVDRRSNPLNVEDARECEAAESGTDDHDRSLHSELFICPAGKKLDSIAVFSR